MDLEEELAVELEEDLEEVQLAELLPHHLTLSSFVRVFIE